MSAIYLVWFRDHTMHAEEETLLLGVFTTRTLALEAARSAAGHEEDEWSIQERFLNQSGVTSGSMIWDNFCEPGGRESYRELYRKYWPAGYPA